MSGLQAPSPATWSVNLPPTAAGMNALRDALNFFLNKPLFKGSFTSGTSLSVNTNLPWPAVEDAYSAWNSSSNYWVVPTGCGGLYKANVSLKWNGTSPASAPAVNVLKNGTKILVSANASSTAGFAGVQLHGDVRVAAGDQIAVQLAGAGFTTQVDTGDNNYFNFAFERL